MVPGKPQRLIRRALWAGLALVVALVLVIAGSAWHVAVASSGHEFGLDDVPERDVALVLGARVYADGRPSPFLKARLDVGLALLQSGKVKAIVVSGDNGHGSYHETDVMKDYLVAAGVPDDKIVEDPHGYDTYDSCVRLKDVYEVTSVTLVSQGYHLPRALTICRSVGMDAVAVGDYSPQATSESWKRGEFREWFAILKMEWDLVTSRKPVLGPVDPSVREAIEA